MATVNQIEIFSKQIQNLFPDDIIDSIVVVDDEDLAEFAKDIDTTQKALLLVVLPSFRPASKDENSLELDSLDSFVFLQKKDKKEGYPGFLEQMKYTEELGIKFIMHLQKIATKAIEAPEGYKYIEFPTLSLEPTSNTKGYCGYSIDFTTKNIL